MDLISWTSFYFFHMFYLISKDYGCLIEDGPYSCITFGPNFINDKSGVISQKSFNDLSVGRDFEEIMRLVQAI